MAIKVISLQGVQDSGKTMTLNKVIDKLKAQGYSQTDQHTNNIPQGDQAVLLVSKSRTRVAVVTIGDPDETGSSKKPYAEALQWCSSKDPEYVICGSREKDGVQITISAIRDNLNVSDKDIRYVRTDKIGPAFQHIENEQKAESILRHLDDLISGTSPVCP